MTAPELPWLIRALLRLFPTDFRRRFAHEIVEAISLRSRESAGFDGRPGVVFWAGTALDILSAGLSERSAWLVWRLAGVGGTLRSSARALRRRPLYTSVAILTLSLGLGGAAAMIAVVRGVVLAPLPYENADDIAVVFNDGRTARPDFDPYWPVSQEQYELFAASGQTVSETTWIGRGSTATLLTERTAELVDAAVVAPNFLLFLGATAYLGRVFTQDDAPEAGGVAVISHATWEARFASDPQIVGRILHVDGQDHTIVGVLDEDFRWYGRGSGSQPELWRPPSPGDPSRGYDRSLIVRVQPGRSLEDVRLEFGPNAYEFFTNDGFKDRFTAADAASILSLREHHLGDSIRRIPLLAGGVGLVVLLAGLSVGLLVVGRMAELDKEFDVRQALGASGLSLAGQVAAENALLVFFGTLAGLGVGAVGLQAAVASAPPGIPRLENAALNPGTVTALLPVAGMLFALSGLLPGWRTYRRRLDAAALRQGRGLTRSKAMPRRVMVGTQVASALVLLLGSGILLRSWHALSHQDVGFRAEGVLAARFQLPDDGWTPVADAARPPSDAAQSEPLAVTGSLLAELDELEARLAAVPGVTEVALARHVPLSGRYGGWTPLTPEGWEDRSWEDRPHGTAANWVTPGYFEALGIAATRGRLLTAEDESPGATPAAVVSQPFAELFWPGDDPIGKRFYAYGAHTRPDRSPAVGQHLVTVVGVVPALREQALQESNVTVFLPYRASIAYGRSPPRDIAVILKTSVPPSSLAGETRRTVSDLFPTQPLMRMEPLEDTVRGWVQDTAFLGSLAAAMGAYGLLLALVGVTGVIAIQVNRRAQEVGIRMALGAGKADIYALFGRETALMVGTGLAVGLAAGVGGARLLQAHLYGVEPLDPWTFGSAPIVFMVAALLVTAVVARRAVEVDPTRALSRE